MDDSTMIKTAAEKLAVQPMTAPLAGGGAPLPMDPAMAGGMPPIPPVGGMGPAGGEEVPPMDPSMLGMGPPMAGGEVPPMDPSMLPPLPEEGEEEEINDPERDMDSDNRADTMVPLGEVKDFAVGIIEATKGKKTQDALPPTQGGETSPAAPDPSGGGILGSIGSAPAAEPMGAMPKLSDIQEQMKSDLG